MAIEQSRYIEINSNVINTTVPERSLQGLVFTDDSMVSGASRSTAYNAGTPQVMTLSEIIESFGASSFITNFATKYFSFVSPSMGVPSRLTVAKVIDETCVANFARVDGLTNDFGSFTFKPGMSIISVSGLQAVATANAAMNYKYLFVVGFDKEDEDASDYISGFTQSGTHVCQGNDTTIAALPMAVTASIDYTASNATSCLMFKQMANETASVTTSGEASTLDANHVNYYGLTQTNGTQLAFYQRGFNADGVDTMVYFNEIWLKSNIETAFFNLVTNVNRIPASDDGKKMISAILSSAIQSALSNGTITIKQSLTTTQTASIISLSGGDSDAPERVLENGYWLDVVIESVSGSSNEYKAVYRLIYSKGDSIRFVQGYHELV